MAQAQTQTHPDQVPLTAEVFPTEGLAEKPDVDNEVLREQSRELVRHWRPSAQGTSKAEWIDARLKKLSLRLAARLAACEKVATLNDLTPPLELLESTRMLGNVLKEAESAKVQVRQLALVDTP